MSITQVGSVNAYNSGNGATTGGMTVTVPSGVAANDVLFVSMSAAASISTPAGWSALSTETSNVDSGVWYRVCDGTEVGGTTTYNFGTGGTNTKHAGWILALRGVDTTAITDVAVAKNNQTSAGTTATWSSVTTVTNGCYLILAGCARNSSNNITGNSFTTVSGYTELADTWSTQGSTGVTGNSGVALDTLLQSSAGATGSQTSTTAKSSYFTNYTVPVKPAGGAITITGAVAAATVAAPAGTVSTTSTLPTRRGYTSVGNVSASTTIAGTLPTGTVQNDVSIVAISINSPSGSVTTPAGWTQLGTINQTSASTLVVLRRVEGASPASQTFTYSPSATASLIWASYSGVDTTTPEDVGFTAGTTQGTTSFPHTGITTSTDSAMVLGGLAFNVAATVTVPSGLTTTTTVGPAAVEQEVADGDIVSPAGATGTLTWTTSASASGTPWLMALRAAVRGITITGVTADTAITAPAGTVSGDALITGPVTGITTAATAGTTTGAATVAGAAGNITTAAPPGIVAVTVPGPTGNITAAAPAGTVTAAQNITITGTSTGISVASPAGTISGAANIPGTVSGLTLTAPAGAVSQTLTGAVSGLTLSSAAGNVTGDATITGVPAASSLTAPAGTLTTTVTIAGTTATVTLTAPGGTVDTAGNVTVPGQPASLTLTAAPGTISTTSTVTISGATANISLTAPAGTILPGYSRTVTGATASLTLVAPAGRETADYEPFGHTAKALTFAVVETSGTLSPVTVSGTVANVSQAGTGAAVQGGTTVTILLTSTLTPVTTSGSSKASPVFDGATLVGT